MSKQIKIQTNAIRTIAENVMNVIQNIRVKCSEYRYLEWNAMLVNSGMN